MIVLTGPPNDGKACNAFVPASGTCFDIIRFINLLLAIVTRSQCGFSAHTAYTIVLGTSEFIESHFCCDGINFVCFALNVDRRPTLSMTTVSMIKIRFFHEIMLYFRIRINYFQHQPLWLGGGMKQHHINSLLGNVFQLLT